MADCMLKISFLPFSSQHRWQHHHTYNTFLVENLFPDVCTYTQKYVARRSQGWPGWLFTRSHAITFHVQHHVTAVVYASLLRIMLRDEGVCDCNFIISQLFYFLSIYQFIHFITYALQYMALFSVRNTKLHKQQCLLHSTSCKTQEFPTQLARPYPRPHASPETRPTSLKARCVSK